MSPSHGPVAPTSFVAAWALARSLLHAEIEMNDEARSPAKSIPESDLGTMQTLLPPADADAEASGAHARLDVAAAMVTTADEVLRTTLGLERGGRRNVSTRLRQEAV